MKDSSMAHWLEDAVSEVVESMCFMSAEITTEVPLESESQCIRRRLVFKGPQQGSFGLGASLSTARLLAGNFLGLESVELGDLQIGEVIGEISNIVCGGFLGRVDSKQVFTLSSPCIDEGTLQVLPSSDRVHVAFNLDEGNLFAWLEIEQGA